MIPQHLSLTQEHYTPEHVVEAARRTLGVIDLDPASCFEANQRVKAPRYFSLPGDGLTERWEGRVFLNPPGGTFTARRKNKSDPKPVTSAVDAAHKLHYRTDSRACAWWRKLMEERPWVPAFVFIGFTVEILRSTQGESWPSAMGFPFCIPAARMCFGGDQPTNANVIVYGGPDFDVFKREFSQIGEVKP